MKLLVTGSSGLIGSTVCSYFAARDHQIHGVDNDQRAAFFGPQGTTRWRQRELERDANFQHHELDIRDREGVLSLFEVIRPNAVVHTAAQPSHDLAAKIPFEDFDINAGGTLNVLEAARRFCAESPLVHMSTNKVYGDGPNRIAMCETESRWAYDDSTFAAGIDESFPIDQCLHSLFGASKVAADVLVQEYGRYFNMPTCCLRGGSLTGPSHSGVELHGFLSYLVKCNVQKREYRVFGYKGKQVRDNIHAYDVAAFIDLFIQQPRSGEVYNMGGGKENSCSILEAFEIVEKLTGEPQHHTYVESHRVGDHICYYSDLRKAQRHYPGWGITKSLVETLEEVVECWNARLRQ